MARLFLLIIVAVVLAFGVGCKSTVQVKTKKPTPGQLKKATGSQSAKPFAPGQQKKK